MRAERSQQLALLDLQELDNKLARITSELKQSQTTAEITALNNELNQSRLAKNEQQTKVDLIISDDKKLASDIALVDSRLDRNAKLLQTNISAKDSQSIEAENTSLKTRKNLLEDNRLELLEKLELAESELEELSVETNSIRTQILLLSEENDRKLAELESSKAVLEKQRVELSNSLPEELLKLYENQLSRYGLGASELRGKVSMPSGIEINPQELHEISAKDLEEVLICPVSQSILVRFKR